MEFHTVYNSYEVNGRDYIGKHTSCNPYDDYKGSFSDEAFRPDEKIVLAYASSQEGAVWLEMQFQKVFQVAENPQFANRSYQTSDKFLITAKGEEHPNFGKSRPDLTQRNLKNNPTRDPKVIEKLKAKRNRKEHNEAVKRARGAPESREKSRQSALAQWSKPGAREALSGKRKGTGNPCHGKRWWVCPSGQTTYSSEKPEGEWLPGRVYKPL